MADEINKKETSEVIDLNGQSQNVGDSALNSIFDRIEAGKAEGKAPEEVLSAPAEKKADPVVEKKEVVEEKKAPEAGSLDEKLVQTQANKESDETDARAALLKATEVKAEKKVEDKPSAEVVKTEDEVPADELQVLPHDKPKTAKRIQALLKKIENVTSEATKTKAAEQEKAAKLVELEKKLGEVKTVDPRTDEEVKKQLDELAMFRRRYDLDKDPEVKKKFDSRVDSAEESIVSTLKNRNAGEALLKAIKEDGGWNGFAASGRVTSIPDGNGGTKQITHAELADLILSNLPLAERKNIEAAMMEQVQTKRDKDRYFKEQQETASQWFKQKEEESTKQQTAQQQQIEEAKKSIDAWRKTVETQEWIKDKEVPEKATPQEKAAIEENNKYNKQLRGLLDKAIGTKDLNGMLEIIQDSIKYYDERRNTANLRKENERLKAEIQAKDDQITKFKTGSRSVPKSGSISTAAAPASQGSKKPESLEDAFDLIASGQKLNGGGDDE